MMRDKVKRKRATPMQPSPQQPEQQPQPQPQQPVISTRRSTRGTFTAQDSFASSDEESDINSKVEKLHQRRAVKVTRRRPAPVTKTAESNKKTQKDDDEQESDDDEEYKADSSDHEEEEVESVDQNGANLMDEVAWLVEGNIRLSLLLWIKR